MKRLLLVVLSMITALSVSACSGDKEKGTEDSSGKKTVVATTTMLCDLTKELAGDNVEVEGLMGPGVDPHLYKPTAKDVNKLEESDMIVYGGLHLEGQMGEVLKNMESDKRIVFESSSAVPKDKLITSSDFEGNYDPHIWFDASIWEDVAKGVAEQLKKLDKENADEYDKNLEAYLSELKDLDNYIKTESEKVPKDQRVLVTAHDAFSYFAKRYGFEVKGIQGISTESEASTSDVSELAKFIADKKIKAIFVESSVPKKNIEALQEAVKAKGFDTEIGGELYSDSLGDDKSGHEKYIDMMRYNIDTIVGALK